MRIRFLQVAQLELDEAVDYYNYELLGLGDAFLVEILKALDRIAKYPESWSPLSKRREGAKLDVSPTALSTRLEKTKSW